MGASAWEASLCRSAKRGIFTTEDTEFCFGSGCLRESPAGETLFPSLRADNQRVAARGASLCRSAKREIFTTEFCFASLCPASGLSEESQQPAGFAIATPVKSQRGTARAGRRPLCFCSRRRGSLCRRGGGGAKPLRTAQVKGVAQKQTRGALL